MTKPSSPSDLLKRRFRPMCHQGLYPDISVQKLFQSWVCDSHLAMSHLACFGIFSHLVVMNSILSQLLSLQHCNTKHLIHCLGKLKFILILLWVQCLLPSLRKEGRAGESGTATLRLFDLTEWESSGENCIPLGT